MKALSDFFTTDYGLMSAAGIVFMLGMASWFTWYFVSHMHSDEQRMKTGARK